MVAYLEVIKGPVPVHKALEALVRAGVTYGYLMKDLQEVLAEPASTPRPVARGRPPEPPQDARVEIADAWRVPHYIDAEGQAHAPAVVAGQLVAVLLPEQRGQPGLTLGGKLLRSPAPRPVTMLCGRGADTAIGASAVRAQQAGRLGVYRWSAGVLVEVVSVLTLDQTLSGSHQSVTYDGDVAVLGDVCNGADVLAAGNVYVAGMVRDVRIRAGGSVVVEGEVMSASLFAGTANETYARAASALKNLANDLDGLLEAIRMLRAMPAFREGDLRHGWAPLLRLLAERKFTALPEHVAAARAALKQPVLAAIPVLADASRLLSEVWHGGYFNEVHGPEPLEELRSSLALAADVAAAVSAGGGHVRMSQCHNSHVVAAGGVFVSGRGSVNSHLTAHGPIEVHQEVLGGTLRSDAGLSAELVGPFAGGEIKVTLPGNAYVNIDKAMAGTVITVGESVHRIDSTQAVHWNLPAVAQDSHDERESPWQR